MERPLDEFPSGIDTELTKAVQHHQLGQLANAEKICRKILKGFHCYGRQNYQDAVECGIYTRQSAFYKNHTALQPAAKQTSVRSASFRET